MEVEDQLLAGELLRERTTAAYPYLDGPGRAPWPQAQPSSWRSSSMPKRWATCTTVIRTARRPRLGGAQSLDRPAEDRDPSGSVSRRCRTRRRFGQRHALVAAEEPPSGWPSSTTTATLSIRRASASMLSSVPPPAPRTGGVQVDHAGDRRWRNTLCLVGCGSPARRPRRDAATGGDLPARPLAILAPAGRARPADPADRGCRHRRRRRATCYADLHPTCRGELRERLRALGLRDGVAAGTFHGVAYAQLRGWWADAGRRPPALLARKSRLLGPLVEGTRVSVAQLAGEIEWAKARLVGPDDYPRAAAAARRRTPAPAEQIAELYRAYEEEKRRAGGRLRRPAAAVRPPAGDRRRLRRCPAVAVPPPVRRRVPGRQPAAAAPARRVAGSSCDLCVVGDHQAIYGWNGADAGFLEDFRLYPTAEVVSLDGNRSTPESGRRR